MFYKMFSDFHSYKAIITFDINIDFNEFKLHVYLKMGIHMYAFIKY